MQELHIIIHENTTGESPEADFVETEDETGASVGNFKLAEFTDVYGYRHIVVTKEDFK